MGVEEAAGQRERGAAEQPRRVRVAFLVGEGVVAAVVGDPGDDVTLHREAARDGEPVAQGAAGLERAVGEVPVEPDGHAESGRSGRRRRPARRRARKAPSPRPAARRRPRPASGARRRRRPAPPPRTDACRRAPAWPRSPSPRRSVRMRGRCWWWWSRSGASPRWWGVHAVAPSRGVVHRGPGWNQPAVAGRVEPALLSVPMVRGALTQRRTVPHRWRRPRRRPRRVGRSRCPQEVLARRRGDDVVGGEAELPEQGLVVAAAPKRSIATCSTPSSVSRCPASRCRLRPTPAPAPRRATPTRGRRRPARLDARHRDHARRHAVGLKRRARLDGDLPLGAGGEQDDAGRAAGCLGQHRGRRPSWARPSPSRSAGCG